VGPVSRPNPPDASAASGEGASGAGEGIDREVDVELRIPAEDPGIPVYARVGRQVLHDGKRVAIPFYRDPARIPVDPDLLRFLDFPGPGGPGAFGCLTALELPGPGGPGAFGCLTAIELG